jgi:hypothetical protein
MSPINLLTPWNWFYFLLHRPLLFVVAKTKWTFYLQIIAMWFLLALIFGVTLWSVSPEGISFNTFLDAFNALWFFRIVAVLLICQSLYLLFSVIPGFSYGLFMTDEAFILGNIADKTLKISFRDILLIDLDKNNNLIIYSKERKMAGMIIAFTLVDKKAKYAYQVNQEDRALIVKVLANNNLFTKRFLESINPEIHIRF